MAVQSGDCLMVRYRECSTGNRDDCPDQNYSFQPCTKLLCPGKLISKTYFVFCFYDVFEKGDYVYNGSLSKTYQALKFD